MPFSDVDASEQPERLIDYLDRAAVALEPLKAQLRASIGAEGPVLDLGCGTGHDLAAFASAGVPSVGLEPSQKMLEQAKGRRRATGASFCLLAGRGQRLPFRSGSFRGCIADRVLQHVQDPEVVLAEIHRVLAPGAAVAIFEPDWGSLSMDADDQGAVAALAAQLASAAPSRRIGLYIRRLLVDAGFVEVTYRVDAATPRSFEVIGYLTNLEAALERAVTEGDISPERLVAFQSQLEERSARGAFFGAMIRVMATGRVPDGPAR